MSDDPEQQSVLRQNLDNPLVSRDNLQLIQELPNDDSRSTFNVTFKSGENEITIPFSARGSSRGEFRGPTLKRALETRNYRSLKDLIMQDFGTPQDNGIMYLVPPQKAKAFPGLEPNEFPAHFDKLRPHLQGRRFANTTLDQLFCTPEAASPPEA